MTAVRAGSPAARVGKLAYGALFVIALPAALALWARSLDAWLPLVRLESRWLGIVIAVLGAGLALRTTVELWRVGGGLPASPFPPPRLVTTGPYRLFEHPIYLGAVAISLGVSLATGSRGGLWVVTPVLAAATVAWVIGFERAFTLRHYGARVIPSVALPHADANRPTPLQRASVCLLVFGPWLLLDMGVELLTIAADARSSLTWWVRLALAPTSSAIYGLLLAFVLLAPLVARTRRDLRELALDSLWAMALVFPLNLLVPFAAQYHLAWAFIAARAWMAAWPPARSAIVTLVVLAVGTCVATALCALPDVAAACAAFLVVRGRGRIARGLLGGAEWIANSWREWTVGPVRLLSHGIYAGVGAALGVGVAVAIAGTAQVTWLVILTASAILGAGVWAQLVEGSQQLLRPYGYFGAVVAVLLVLALAALAGVDLWETSGAFCIGSTVTYAFGRMRCLVQGCCHGAPTSAASGIVYRHPRSRVVRLSAYGGVPVHATQVYSALWMLLVGAVLLRLWSLAAPLPFIVGGYFILTGLGRFVEEHYRGEPQTLVIGGMRLYQWLAIALVVIGAAVTTLPGPLASTWVGLDAGVAWALLAVAVVAYAAYGVDFPRSDRRLSRLV